MHSKELIKEGKLVEARKLLVEEVKSSPADTGKRTLLFQVLLLFGQWDKAENHLSMIEAQDPSRSLHIQTCQKLISAEKERENTSRGKT